MADTISTYQRQKSDAQYLSTVRTPSASSMEAQSKYTRQYVAGLTGLVEGVGKVADAYWTAIEHREERDADSSATELFRQRRADIRQNVKGKGADGLLDRETEWTKDQFNKWVKDKGISTQAGKLIWEKHARQHLDKVGAYMIEQQAAYDKASRMRWVDNQIDNLAESKTGDMNWLKEVWRQAELTFPDDPMQAEKYIDKATTMAFGTWSARDPEGTLKWFDANSGEIAKVIGSKFPQAQKTMEVIRRRLIREAEHQAAQAAAQAAREAAAFNRQSHQLFGQAINAMIAGNNAKVNAILHSGQMNGSDALRLYKTVQAGGARAKKGTPGTAEAKAAEKAVINEWAIKAHQLGVNQDQDGYQELMIQAAEQTGNPNVLAKMQQMFNTGKKTNASARPAIQVVNNMANAVYSDKVQRNIAKANFAQAVAENPGIAKDAATAMNWFQGYYAANKPREKTIAEQITERIAPPEELTVAPTKRRKSTPAPAAAPATPPAADSSSNSILKALQAKNKLTPTQKQLLDTSEAQVRQEDAEQAGPRPGLID